MNNTRNLIKYYDESIGKVIVIDAKTGFSSYQELNQNNSQKAITASQTANQSIIDLNDPKNDPKNDNINAEIRLKKRSFIDDNESDKIDDTYGKFGWKNSNNNCDNNNKFPLRADMKIDVSIKLNKSFLSNPNLRVIGQVDHKFIICLLVKQNLLLAFDQHAVHERIRYERVVNNAFDSKGVIKTYRILPPIDISLDLPQLKYSFNTYRNQIKSLVGFELKEDTKQNSFLVTQIPECLERSLDCETIVDIIKEAVTILKQSNGSPVIRLTPKLLENLQSQACHGAIRFGDPLKLHDCLKLITSLSKCNVCFRCAHGRCSVAPLLHLPQKLN